MQEEPLLSRNECACFWAPLCSRCDGRALTRPAVTPGARPGPACEGPAWGRTDGWIPGRVSGAAVRAGRRARCVLVPEAPLWDLGVIHVTSPSLSRLVCKMPPEGSPSSTSAFGNPTRWYRWACSEPRGRLSCWKTRLSPPQSRTRWAGYPRASGRACPYWGPWWTLAPGRCAWAPALSRSLRRPILFSPFFSVCSSLLCTKAVRKRKYPATEASVFPRTWLETFWTALCILRGSRVPPCPPGLW